MGRERKTSAEAARSLRERFRLYCNGQRDDADVVAAKYGCDDPLHPWGDLTERQRHYTNWIEFADVVCRPIAEGSDEAAVQAAMVLYRQACPHYIAVALVMAANRVADTTESPSEAS